MAARRNNTTRVMHAGQAIQTYTRAKYGRVNLSRFEMVDLLTDLQHWFESHGQTATWADTCALASIHYEAEAGEG